MLFGALALFGAGCAGGTRVATFGPLPTGDKLVTLVVTEDLDVVRRECDNVPRAALQATQVLGCQMSKPLRPDGALPVRAIKIVRFAESLPSLVTFEIDAHELCHAIASLQLLADPCHEGNAGELQARWR